MPPRTGTDQGDRPTDDARSPYGPGDLYSAAMKAAGPPGPTLRVAALEIPQRFGEVPSQLGVVDHALGCLPGVDLVLLPETILTGYVSPTGDADLRPFAEADVLLFPSAWVQGPGETDSREGTLSSLARASGVWIVNANWGVSDPPLGGQGGSMVVSPAGAVVDRIPPGAPRGAAVYTVTARRRPAEG